MLFKILDISKNGNPDHSRFFWLHISSRRMMWLKDNKNVRDQRRIHGGGCELFQPYLHTDPPSKGWAAFQAHSFLQFCVLPSRLQPWLVTDREEHLHGCQRLPGPSLQSLAQITASDRNRCKYLLGYDESGKTAIKDTAWWEHRDHYAQPWRPNPWKHTRFPMFQAVAVATLLHSW